MPPGDDDAGRGAGACAAPALPAWVAALAPGEWRALPGTRLSSVDPVPLPDGNTGPASKVIGWTSFVVDERTSKLYVLAAGGHNDYAGNEVDVLDLEASVPAWVELVPATPSSQVVGCGPYYRDGRPISRETFYGVALDARQNRVLLLGGVPYFCAGNPMAAVSSFDLTRNAWNPAGTNADLPAGLAGFGLARDPASDDLFAFNGGAVYRWAEATDAWARLSGGHDWGYAMMAALDPRRGRVLITGGSGFTAHHTFTPATGAVDLITLGGPESAAAQGSQDALVYVPALDRFLVRQNGAGGDVFQIDPDTFAATRFPTTGGAAVPATINGPFNKFLYVPRLRGAVYVPAHGSDTWFLRLHSEAAPCLGADGGTSLAVSDLRLDVRCGCAGSPLLGSVALALLLVRTGARRPRRGAGPPSARRTAPSRSR